MKKHTKCRMNEICRRPHRDGECERNCYYNTIEVKTNADCFRAMTDEKMAEFFEMIPHLGNPPTYTIDGFCIDDGLRTKRQWLDWLKQEATDAL